MAAAPSPQGAAADRLAQERPSRRTSEYIRNSVPARGAAFPESSERRDHEGVGEVVERGDATERQIAVQVGVQDDWAREPRDNRIVLEVGPSERTYQGGMIQSMWRIA